MPDGLLTGFRALDLTDHKGWICGKILASMGVEVIKIEPPGGEPDRNIPPFLQARPDPENSFYWNAFNTDKRSITLDIQSVQGKELFQQLARNSDFVLESFAPGFIDGLGLGYSDLAGLHPGTILTSITPFGQKGPYAHFKGSELIASAMGGVLLTNGDPDRPPVKEGPESNIFQSNAAAAAGTMLAHYHRQMTGHGQHVDVSMQEVAASRTTSNLLIWMFDRRLIPRSGNIRNVGARSTRQFWPCRDGAVFWMFAGGRMRASANRALARWMMEEGMDNAFCRVTNWEAFDVIGLPKEIIDEYQEAIGGFFMKHTKKELTEEGFERGIEACMVNNASDLLEYEQLQARNFWTHLKGDEAHASLVHPRHFFLSNHTKNVIRKRAPRIGEDNESVFRDVLGLSNGELVSLKEAGVI